MSEIKYLLNAEYNISFINQFWMSFWQVRQVL